MLHRHKTDLLTVEPTSWTRCPRTTRNIAAPPPGNAGTSHRSSGSSRPRTTSETRRSRDPRSPSATASTRFGLGTCAFARARPGRSTAPPSMLSVPRASNPAAADHGHPTPHGVAPFDRLRPHHWHGGRHALANPLANDTAAPDVRPDQEVCAAQPWRWDHPRNRSREEKPRSASQ